MSDSYARQRAWFFAGCYLFIVVFSVFGLVINIKTLHLNEDIQKFRRHSTALKELNTELRIQIEQKTHLYRVNRIASETLLMVQPKRVYYIGQRTP